MDTVYRGQFGRVITIAVGAIGGAALASLAVTLRWADLGQLAPWLALLTGCCWAIFWRPHVQVTDGGVRVVNVTRTIDIPWPALQAVETRWALTLSTAHGRFSAWAAPAAGRAGVRRAARREISPLGRAAREANAGRGPKVPELGPAEEAAELVRRQWEQLRTAGHLDHPLLEHDRAPVRWHVGTLAAGAALIGIGIATIVI